jgi:hypothetical protein
LEVPGSKETKVAKKFIQVNIQKSSRPVPGFLGNVEKEGRSSKGKEEREGDMEVRKGPLLSSLCTERKRTGRHHTKATHLKQKRPSVAPLMSLDL